MYNANGIFYNEQHTIAFGEVVTTYSAANGYKDIFTEAANTWTTNEPNSVGWHLIPTEVPTVVVPSVSTKTLDRTGKDGNLDLTSFLANKPNFGTRNGSFSFYVVPSGSRVDNIQSSMISKLQLRRMAMILQDDPDNYYVGRFSVGAINYSDNLPTITINYQLDPFKYSLENDPNYPETNYKTYRYELNDENKGRDFDFYDFLPEPIAVWISGDLMVRFNSQDVEINQSNNIFRFDKALAGETNQLRIRGTGTVLIQWRKGML